MGNILGTSQKPLKSVLIASNPRQKAPEPKIEWIDPEIYSLMNSKGPYITAVLLRANGKIEQIPIDMTDSVRVLEGLLGCNGLSIVGG